MEIDGLARLQTSLARSLVSSVAPEEAEYFDEIILQQQSSRRHRDEELGSGLSIADIGVASMAVLTISKPLLNFIWENARDSAGELVRHASEDVRLAFERRLDAWINGGAKDHLPAALPPDTTKATINSLVEEASVHGLNVAQAKLLHDRLATSLAD